MHVDELASERRMQERKMRPKRSMQGEIVEVEGGGRIIRALSRKDRHSKVCTARGPKDRRVRLSATTAIQFYDVQDRLGYDRPSLAIDWLMNEAKPAIDALNNGNHLLPAMKSSPSNCNILQELEGYYNLLNHDCQKGENGIQNQLQNLSEFHTSCFGSFFNTYPESLNSRNTTHFSTESTHEVTEEMVAWNSISSPSNGKESAQGFDIDSSSEWRFTQREPLQSSYLPSIQASVPAPNTSFGIGLATDGFLGFSFPTRIQGQEDEEQEKLVSEQLPSASSLLHYQY